MSERHKISIEQKRVDRGESNIKRRLLTQGFTIGRSSPIPAEFCFTYFPINEDKAAENASNILSAIQVMKEWDEGATGIIAGVGLGLKNMQDTTPINTLILNIGGWDYLYQLGKKKNIDKKEIRRAVVQAALDPSNKNAQVTLETLVHEVTIPDWIDKDKSTNIEKLAASFVTNNGDASKAIKKLNEAEGKKYISAVASVDKRSAEVAIYTSFKPWKWLEPILKTLSFVKIYHEIAHKVVMGEVDNAQSIYKSGLIRSTKAESGVYEVVKKILEEKEKPKENIKENS